MIIIVGQSVWSCKFFIGCLGLQFVISNLSNLTIMGQNLALNVVEKDSSIYNHTRIYVDERLEHTQYKGNLPLTGFYDPKDFALSIHKDNV